MLLAGSARLAGQEHGQAKTTAPTVATKSQSVQVAPTLPPAKVAAAVAEALREAEAAEAKRAAGPAARPLHARRTPVAAAQPRKYEVRWPEQRMVVQWPSTASDHVTLTWPGTLLP
jgi:hypothetical protein